MSRPVVELQDVSFGYDRRPTLEQVTLQVHEGDFAGIVGPNGGGKTTLVRLILGLLTPQKGEIKVLDRLPDEARQLVGYMPQRVEVDPRFPVTALDVILMGRVRAVGPYRKSDRQAARQALDEVGLGQHERQLFSELSGGQRQRVLIARAIVGNPQLLVLDEPTASLDLAVEQELYEVLQELNKRMTILMVSHDLGFISPFVTKVICVKGRVSVHPTSEITGEIISEVYGSQVQMIRHDHTCGEGGRPC